MSLSELVGLEHLGPAVAIGIGVEEVVEVCHIVLDEDENNVVPDHIDDH